MFRQKYEYFVTNIKLVDSFFEDSFKTLVESGKPFSKCGKCRRYMKLVEARPQRLYCPTCQEQYPVPSAKDASVRLHGEHLCPIDGFELLYFHPAGGKLAKSFAFCPHCYNNPPFEDMRGRHPGCNECSHPECQHSYISQGVLQCLTRCFGGRGTLVLDPQSGPKWRLSCNKCPAVVSIFEGASKLKVMDRCEKCGARKLSVEYKNAKTSKLPDQACNFVGCAFCEQHNLGECVNFRHAFLDKEPTIGGSRGTRGNRGGRGRGRGQPPEAILQIVTTSPQAAGVLEGEELEDKVEERAVEGA
uniref:DNA topoisomerase n=1 Tax=Meloidogyne incognita TaxID=6306 RepID=A0A914KL38_MELIC